MVDVDIDILPPKFSGAAYLRGAMAIEGTTDLRGIGTLTTIEMFTPVTFRCQWEPFITSTGLIIVYFEFRNNTSYMVLAAEDFMDRIRVI